MKITRIDIYMLDAGAQRAKRRPVCCRISTDEGICGDGEAGIAFGLSAPAGIGVIQDLATVLIGMNPMRVDAIWEKLFKESFWGQGGGPVFFSGMSAIDIALMDIKGKALGVPVYELLGGKYRDKLRCYASQLQFGWNESIGPFGPKEEYAAIAKYAMDDGYDAIKVDFTWFDRNRRAIDFDKCEGFLSLDFLRMVEERMAAIRETCGNVDMIMENHARTDTISSIKLGELCDKYGIYAYEEPTSLLNLDALKNVQARVKTPIAAGERIYTRWQYINFFKNNAIQLVQPDACNCGGITECKKICDMAHAFDVKAQIHCAGGPISTAAAITNFAIYEHHFRSTQPSVTALGKYDYQPKDGMYEIPNLPGIGQEMSEFAIESALAHVTVE
jgi:L-alanine-DL-glutamate epimerase-like enolase superfamily enzyme